MATDLSPQIGSSAQNPASVEADGLSVAAHPLPAVIAADQYLAAKSAGAQKRRGLRFSKLIAPGAFPDSQTTGIGGLGNFSGGGNF